MHSAAACRGVCVINKQSHKISRWPPQFTFSAHSLQTDFIFISVGEKCFPVYGLQHCSRGVFFSICLSTFHKVMSNCNAMQ